MSNMTGYGMEDQDSSLGRGRNYFLRHRVQFGSEADAASYLKGSVESPQGWSLKLTAYPYLVSRLKTRSTCPPTLNASQC
jgi:hypothetical protein